MAIMAVNTNIPNIGACCTVHKRQKRIEVLPLISSEGETLREKDVDIELVNQPIGTVGEDGWTAEMMLNMMIVVRRCRA